MKTISAIMLFVAMIFGGVVHAQNSAPLGSNSEDALKVQPELYEPPLKIDSKSVQRQVYKTVFKQEMKESRPSEAPEEE